jgi:2-dehydropantoate 2-reductase
VLGPGALGCLLAARLHEAGEEVILVDYRPERVALLRRQGIRVQTLGGISRLAAVPIGLPAEAGARDLTIITVKAHQTAAAARDLPRLLCGGGMALTLQNGLGNLEELARQTGWARLLAGVALLGVTREGEGRVVLAGAGPIFIGIPAGSQVSPAELRQVVDLLRRAGLDGEERGDIAAALWEKLLVNVGVNPLTALLRVANGVLPELAPAWELGVAAAGEAAAVARAAGINLTAEPGERLLQVCRATAANRSSMLQDVLAGRPTEIEALNGQVCVRGRTLGVATPVNDLLTRLVRALEMAAPRQVE